MDLVVDEPKIIESHERVRHGCCGLPPSLRLAGEEAAELAAIFKAIGHPVRLQIIDLLNRYGGRVCVCDIESQFDLAQPTISHHLKVLRKSGIIDCERRGLWAFYFARQDTLRALKTVLSDWTDSAPA